jgi:hypothetical protein
MNDKKDDSEEKTELQDDTASLLESLFKDTKSSQIKVVKRRVRSKSGVKKRAISKQRKDEGEEASRTPARKRVRLSPSEKSSRATKSKPISRKTFPPGSTVPKDSKAEQSRRKLRHVSTAGAKPTSKSTKGDGRRIADPGETKKEKSSPKTIAGPGEERTESLDQSVLDSMISMASGIKGSGKKPHHELSPEERQILKSKKGGGDKTSKADDLRTGPPAEIEGVARADKVITEIMGKSTLESMISGIKGSGKEGGRKASAKESQAPEEEETGATIFFDSDDLREKTSPDIEGIAGADKVITEIMGKSTLESMISEIEGRGKEGDRKASAKKSPAAVEEETGAEIFFDSDDLKKGTSAEIEEVAGADEEITEILEKSALSSMISALEGSGEEGEDRPPAVKSPVSGEKEASADIEGIDGATEETPLSQEKPAAPSSITIEDSFLEASALEEYPESTLEEKSIPEDRREGVEDAPQAVDLREEQPSDSANAELTKEKTLSQEKPAESTSIPHKTPRTKADMFEVHHILEEKERPIVKDKKEGIEVSSEAVDLEAEPLSDSSGPEKEEPIFQEIAVPNLMSSEDSTVYTSEEEHHDMPAAEEELMPKGDEEGIEEISESTESKKEEPADLEEGIALTEAEFQVIRRSGRRSKVIRIGLPLLLFGVFAVILTIQYSPLDFFRHEQTQKLASDKTVEIPSAKKQEITPEPLRETAPAAKQGVQPSTPASTKREIVRAPVPRRKDAAPETQKETVAALAQDVQPSTSEPPPILAMKESVEGIAPVKQDTTPKTPKETSPATEQEVRPEPSGLATSPPPSEAAAEAEANQRETSTSYPYTVYLGSYRTIGGVEKAVPVYSEKGLSSLYWQEVDLGDKGLWYRVFTGHFKTKGEAEEYVKDRQLADAEVRKTRQSASTGSIPVKDVVPQKEAPEKQRLLPEATAESSFPFSVYIGSYKDLDHARRAISDSQAKGTSYWVKTDLGEKGIWYRVYVGCFQTREQAETFIKTHQIADGESRRTPYANFIGTYSSDEELEKIRLSLLNLEFSPYVIEASGGGSHLFTGAFYQKARAEKQHLDLKAKGIQSQVVER